MNEPRFYVVLLMEAMRMADAGTFIAMHQKTHFEGQSLAVIPAERPGIGFVSMLRSWSTSREAAEAYAEVLNAVASDGRHQVLTQWPRAVDNWPTVPINDAAAPMHFSEEDARTLRDEIRARSA